MSVDQTLVIRAAKKDGFETISDQVNTTMPRSKTSKNIFLIGFMGSGKTTVGRRLAKRLGRDFVDLDEYLEKRLGITIPQIFTRFGECFFRDAEYDALQSVSKKNRQVIATGGGVVLRDENWKLMKKKGITIYLKASPEVLWSRVKGNTARPLLQVENPYKKVLELLSKRNALYEKADFIVDTENVSPQNVVEEIERMIKLSFTH